MAVFYEPLVRRFKSVRCIISCLSRACYEEAKLNLFNKLCFMQLLCCANGVHLSHCTSASSFISNGRRFFSNVSSVKTIFFLFYYQDDSSGAEALNIVARGSVRGRIGEKKSKNKEQSQDDTAVKFAKNLFQLTVCVQFLRC